MAAPAGCWIWLIIFSLALAGAKRLGRSDRRSWFTTVILHLRLAPGGPTFVAQCDWESAPVNCYSFGQWVRFVSG